ncbi:39S mitochondrial ribosomal protein L46-domain-containing protein [Elsinoe ampelina]|uniref:Large ribosomal subunit protein mL46 n=1 Tax=Elsinoe ampelina TaxID=302913 RepID=A0A6A6FZ08_9PEZI|nr:39S mitochondrial ribosomal protein L46-domain-containing protein [Elsinoe ampelina]
MTITTRTARRALLTEPSTICLSCRISLRLASTATAPSPTPQPTTPQPTSSSPPQPQQSYRVLTSVILSRPPFLTRPLHPFEKSYHLYNRRLNERLALPFTRYFYYKKGTPSDGEWKRKIRARLTPSRDVGVYSAYGSEGWNDEVLIGDRTGEEEEIIEEVIRDAEGAFETPAGGQQGQEEYSVRQAKKEPVVRPVGRVSAADREGDRRSLDRRGERTLYLLVRNGEGRWVFPGDVVRGREGLHQAAERVLVQAGGINMNTWVVGNAPIGWYQYDFPKTITHKERNVEELGEKVFFMKARIMAGQADLTKNVLGDTDFLWLTKEEVQETVTNHYFSQVRNMLAER